jgi:hypothetical protein
VQRRHLHRRQYLFRFLPAPGEQVILSMPLPRGIRALLFRSV